MYCTCNFVSYPDFNKELKRERVDIKEVCCSLCNEWLIKFKTNENTNAFSSVYCMSIKHPHPESLCLVLIFWRAHPKNQSMPADQYFWQVDESQTNLRQRDWIIYPWIYIVLL